MVLIGLLLIAAAVAAAIILVVQNDHTVAVHVFHTDYNIAAYWLAIAGLVIMAVLTLGISAVRAGTAHRMRLRRERRELLQENRRLSERAAAVGATGTGQSSSHTRPSAAAGNAGTGSAGGAHAEPVRSRADEPRRDT